METPLSVYWKLTHDQPTSVLLESVTGGENLARYSMIGMNPLEVVRVKDRIATISDQAGTVTAQLADGEDALDFLHRRIPKVDHSSAEGLPKFCGGAVGVIGYDFVRSVEKLPPQSPDTLAFDDLAMMICPTVAVFDHAKNIIKIICLAERSLKGYEMAKAEIESLLAKLRQPTPPLPGLTHAPGTVSASMDQPTFEAAVETVRDYIAAGDCIQVVPSIRFSTACDAHPLTVYRALRSLNPSPYMYLLRFPDFDVVGASPEILVGLEGQTARVRPIAGTRRRGATPAEDDLLGKELLADEKERAEHIMLVDLGRNDLGRVCQIGTVNVGELMVIEKYSHVMHIVSEVTGSLAPDKSGADLIRATFPAGTVSGAPKIRAMEIIDELEPTRRGLYAGAVGYWSATGDIDLAIAIRTILIKNGQAHVQAGAGIVTDSVPASEYQECVSKAQAALKAVEIAHRGLV